MSGTMHSNIAHRQDLTQAEKLRLWRQNKNKKHVSKTKKAPFRPGGASALLAKKKNHVGKERSKKKPVAVFQDENTNPQTAVAPQQRAISKRVSRASLLSPIQLKAQSKRRRVPEMQKPFAVPENPRFAVGKKSTNAKAGSPPMSKNAKVRATVRNAEIVQKVARRSEKKQQNTPARMRAIQSRLAEKKRTPAQRDDPLPKMLYKALQHMEAKQYTEAEAEFQAMLELTSKMGGQDGKRTMFNSPQFWIQRARASELMGNNKAAIAIFQEAKKFAQPVEEVQKSFAAFLERLSSSLNKEIAAAIDQKKTGVQQSREVKIPVMPSSVSTPLPPQAQGMPVTPVACQLHRLCFDSPDSDTSGPSESPQLPPQTNQATTEQIVEPALAEPVQDNSTLTRESAKTIEFKELTESDAALTSTTERDLGDEDPMSVSNSCESSPVKSRSESSEDFMVSSPVKSHDQQDENEAHNEDATKETTNPNDSLDLDLESDDMMFSPARFSGPRRVPISDPSPLRSISSELSEHAPQNEEEEGEVYEGEAGLSLASMSASRVLVNHTDELVAPKAQDTSVQGSSVVIFSPMRAKGKMSRVLGTNTVLTPVRRSSRNASYDDLLKASQAPSLLAGTGYCYVPNASVTAMGLKPPIMKPATEQRADSSTKTKETVVKKTLVAPSSSSALGSITIAGNGGLGLISPFRRSGRHAANQQKQSMEHLIQVVAKAKYTNTDVPKDNSVDGFAMPLPKAPASRSRAEPKPRVGTPFSTRSRSFTMPSNDSFAVPLPVTRNRNHSRSCGEEPEALDKALEFVVPQVPTPRSKSRKKKSQAKKDTPRPVQRKSRGPPATPPRMLQGLACVTPAPNKSAPTRGRAAKYGTVTQTVNGTPVRRSLRITPRK